MTDASAYYLVTYRVKKSGVYRTRVYREDGHLNSLRNTSNIEIKSVKIVNPALPGEGLHWLDKVKRAFERMKVFKHL